MEPFWWTLDYIAELTDDQIISAIAAASNRAKELAKQRGGSGTPATFDPDKATEEEQRRQYGALGATLGLSKQQIQYQWDHRFDPQPKTPILPSSLSPERGPKISSRPDVPREKKPTRHFLISGENS